MSRSLGGRHVGSVGWLRGLVFGSAPWRAVGRHELPVHSFVSGRLAASVAGGQLGWGEKGPHYSLTLDGLASVFHSVGVKAYKVSPWWNSVTHFQRQFSERFFKAVRLSPGHTGVSWDSVWIDRLQGHRAGLVAGGGNEKGSDASCDTTDIRHLQLRNSSQWSWGSTFMRGEEVLNSRGSSHRPF